MSANFSITIDDRPVEVQPGETVLAAARRLGIDIPTLCYLERCGPLTSCLVCLVKVRSGGGRLLPSCGLPVQPGMAIESETEEVHTARRTALELLFSDHVGDCLSPCHRLCPLQLNIPVMLRHVEADELTNAVQTVVNALPLPAILGRLCHRPCENGCRRGNHDEPAAIRDVERFVADHDLASASPYQPPRRPPTGHAIAIVGAGPAGLAAANFLLREGHAVTLVDRHEQPGGSLREAVATGALEARTLAAELDRLRAMGAQFRAPVELGHDVTIEGLLRGFGAVLLTLGARGRSQGGPLGLPVTPTGLKVEADTGRTPLAKVYAAGSTVRPAKHLVRAMADGRAAAMAIHRTLTGTAPPRTERAFSSVMGRLDPAELRQFLVGPNPAPRTASPVDLLRGFTSREAGRESGRCLHCDCRAEGNCKLEHYARQYGAEPARFRTTRRAFEQQLQHGEIIFEPGKCILCGICVKIAEQAREPLGLTFVGRGFDVKVAAPLNHTIAEGLQQVGRECVEACPTGALALKDEVERFNRRQAAAGGCGGGGCRGGGGGGGGCAED